jgi:tol-pal system protein YbgF
MQEMKKRLAILEEQVRQGREGTGEQAGELQSADGKSPASSMPPDKKSRYEDAYSAFIQKRYKEARDKFEAFAKDFPKDELTDNAYFWIGETYFGEKDYEGAILAYETFLKKYLNSPKAPSAMYKQGICFLEIRDKKTGKVILEQVLERYPKSKEAELAKKKLNELNQKPAQKK